MSKVLELKNIEKTFYAGTINENYVLKNLSLELEDGDYVTVIGGNGAGKSTMLNVISGALHPDSGHVIIDGEDVTKLKEYQRAKYLGRVFQD
ncbi:MAG: ATP-binding cassette domain-containing protein, partial [Oscillospiraceae bacterium]|nr:ATP-binding cassette domain-containing protein [Oscillospiraceae bacterium]